MPLDSQQGIDDFWVKLPTPFAFDLGQSFLFRPGVLIWTGVGEGVESVGDGYDAGRRGMFSPRRPCG